MRLRAWHVACSCGPAVTHTTLPVLGGPHWFTPVCWAHCRASCSVGELCCFGSNKQFRHRAALHCTAAWRCVAAAVPLPTDLPAVAAALLLAQVSGWRLLLSCEHADVVVALPPSLSLSLCVCVCVFLCVGLVFFVGLAGPGACVIACALQL